MRTKERGNAILISAILVFALTVTALGISRLLVKGTQQMTAQREFLGLQAQALAEAGLHRWAILVTNHATLAQPQVWNDFSIFRAATPSATTANGTVSITWANAGTAFVMRASASIRSIIDPTVFVERSVGATATCPLGPLACTAGPTIVSGTP